MFINVFLELIILIAIIFVGYSYWQLILRDRFARKVMNNQELLDSIFSIDNFLHPPDRVALYAKINKYGWIFNIDILLKSDVSTQRKMKYLYLFIVVLLLLFSYLLGIVFFLINFICFSFLAFFPISNPAKLNALENIHCLALILYKWSSENSLECDKWIEQAQSVRKLYNVIKRLEISS
jgi:hypothetical protein